MNKNPDQHYTMGIQDFFTWRSQTASHLPPTESEELPADLDEPPDHIMPQSVDPQPEFYKSLVRPQSARKESLLTKAFQAPKEDETTKPEMKITTDLTRRRSMMSNASLASTAELTSDGGFTSPARMDTPSPPYPKTTYTTFSPYSFSTKPKHPAPNGLGQAPTKEESAPAALISVSPKAPVPVAPPRKRCISFMCDGKKGTAADKTSPTSSEAPLITAPPPDTARPDPPKPRKSMIQFACPGPNRAKAIEKIETAPAVKPVEPQKRTLGRSPSIPRKSPRPNAATRSTSSIRRASQSPAAIRIKPKYIIADEKTINTSEATRFHEFASGEIQEDDWIKKDVDSNKAKITIKDTLQKENAIRQLGNEAEQEALDEDEEDDEDDGSDDENDDEDDDDLDDEFLDDGSDDDASDGNETDNEAGFAESDESDAEGEFAFWTPGARLSRDEASTYRPSAHRAASTSSIDSLNHMSPKHGKAKRRPIKIRPGTPDLPDSTDFVCGTLDEDRPLEDAYVSCMEARKNAKHKQTPQDIDPSFPTSDPEDDEDEVDDVAGTRDSDEHLWIHGKFEESDDERHGRRRSTILAPVRKSPNLSPRRLHSPPPPKRLHSPPPPKQRLRSPPPRKLFGNSPRRRSPSAAGMSMKSPQGSPTESASRAIAFAPLGSRPGLTHTKSLPRTPNAFCRQYAKSRLAAANGNEGSSNQDMHTRGAIDIVKGLEQKRQRRKEKFYRKNRGQPERRPQPGKGAERMRELGLHMAGKTGAQDQDPYMLSA